MVKKKAYIWTGLDRVESDVYLLYFGVRALAYASIGSWEKYPDISC